MKEVFFTLGVIALLRHLGLSLGLPVDLLIVAGLLIFDLWLSVLKRKDMAQLEAFKLYMGSATKEVKE